MRKATLTVSYFVAEERKAPCGAILEKGTPTYSETFYGYATRTYFYAPCGNKHFIKVLVNDCESASAELIPNSNYNSTKNLLISVDERLTDFSLDPRINILAESHHPGIVKNFQSLRD